MNFNRVRWPGFWIPGSVVLPEELEQLDDHQSNAINGTAGSTHAPSGQQIVIGGLGLYVTGEASFDSIASAALTPTTGRFRVTSGSMLWVESGGVAQLLLGSRLDVLTGAELRVTDGSFINVQAGGSVDVHGAVTLFTGAGIVAQSGSLSVLEPGSTFTSQGAFYFANGTWPKLSPDRTWERHSLRICNLTYDTSSEPEPAKPDVWIRQSDQAGGAECIQTRAAASSGRYHWIELVNLPDGGTITTVSVTSQGTLGTGVVTLPTYQVVRWQGSGAKQSMSSVVTDAHSGANWTTATLTTSLSIIANNIIDKSYRYALIVFHPFESGFNGAMRVYDVKATGTASELRL